MKLYRKTFSLGTKNIKGDLSQLGGKDQIPLREWQREILK